MAKAKLPPGPLKVFSGAGVTAILDANGNEVVGWPGFDDSNRTRAEHELLARELVRRYNDALGVRPLGALRCTFPKCKGGECCMNPSNAAGVSACAGGTNGGKPPTV